MGRIVLICGTPNAREVDELGWRWTDDTVARLCHDAHLLQSRLSARASDEAGEPRLLRIEGGRGVGGVSCVQGVQTGRSAGRAAVETGRRAQLG